MLTPNYVTALAATVSFVHLVHAIPTVSPPPPPYPDSVLYSWSTEPICTTTASSTDCTTAYTALCARTKLGVSDNATVGGCTAFYWYDSGNTIPTVAQCTAAYTQILATSIGGALGYNAAEKRTNDPLYAIYPTDGNPNCFKAAGDTSPVLAMDALPNGKILATCPVSSSRQRRALKVLEGRDQTGTDWDDPIYCMVEEHIWGVACTGVCLATVTATSWITGPFVAVGWLACLGTCSATSTKLFNNCQKAKGNTDPEELIPQGVLNPFGKRQHAAESSDPCVNIKQWLFQCPAQEVGLLSTFSCDGTIETSKSTR